jgi:peptidoglycan-associated lipoprotein
LILLTKKGIFMKSITKKFFTVALLSLVVASCSSNSKKDGDAANSMANGDMDNALELNGSSDNGSAGPLQTIYFGFDSSSLNSSARGVLEANAMFLRNATNVEVQVEGHADERGGEQYNLALGERRANAVQDYLIALGVDASRVTIISLGKTTPKSFGHEEGTWSQNRRANFSITAK